MILNDYVVMKNIFFRFRTFLSVETNFQEECILPSPYKAGIFSRSSK